MQKTKIEYLTHTWSPIAMRCTPISEGCKNCWHLALANRLSKNPTISKDKQKAYAGGKPILIEKELGAPLKLKKSAIIGVQFMGDLFHEDVSFFHILEIFKIIAKAPRHTFMILTKRPDRATEFYNYINNYKKIVSYCKGLPLLNFWPLKNVWLGVTCENQQAADERIPILLQIPAAVRFISIEPMLSEINLEMALENFQPLNPDFSKKPSSIQWVIVGGESGPGARPMHPNWVRSIRNQCQESETPFFFKQWGEYIESIPFDGYSAVRHTYKHDTAFYRLGKKKAGRILDGRVWEEYPS